MNIAIFYSNFPNIYINNEKLIMTEYWQYRQSGFTLIELMVVVSIIGIIAMMAYPSMQQQINQTKIKNAVNIFEASTKEARSQALLMQTDVLWVLTNTSTEKKLTIGNKSYELDKNLTITKVGSAPDTIIFTRDKKAKDGVTKHLMNSNQQYQFCMGTNANVNKYSVSVDALTNVKVEVIGGCP